MFSSCDNVQEEYIFLYIIYPSHLHCPEEGKLSWQLVFKHLSSLPQPHSVCSMNPISWEKLVDYQTEEVRGRERGACMCQYEICTCCVYFYKCQVYVLIPPPSPHSCLFNFFKRATPHLKLKELKDRKWQFLVRQALLTAKSKNNFTGCINLSKWSQGTIQCESGGRDGCCH